MLDICSKILGAAEGRKGQMAVKAGTGITERGGAKGVLKEGKPFDSMNNIVANLLLNLTR